MRMTTNICDIEGCERISTFNYPIYLHGQQKGEDSFGAWVFYEPVDLCAIHEQAYRSSLPNMRLKSELADAETRIDRE